MRTIGMLAAAALACIVANAPGLAQAPAAPATGYVPEDPAVVAKREAATNLLLFEALAKRRAAIAVSANDPPARRYALDFIDRRLAELKSRVRG